MYYFFFFLVALSRNRGPGICQLDASILRAAWESVREVCETVGGVINIL